MSIKLKQSPNYQTHGGKELVLHIQFESIGVHVLLMSIRDNNVNPLTIHNQFYSIFLLKDFYLKKLQ